MPGPRIPRAVPDGPITDDHWNSLVSALEKFGITVAAGSGLFVRSGVIGLARPPEGWIKLTAHTSGADYTADRVVRIAGTWAATAYVGETATESSGYTGLATFPTYARAVWEEDRWIFQSDQC